MLKARATAGLVEYSIGFALSRVATVAILPVVSRSVGAEGYGYFEASFAVLLAATVLTDTGAGAALVRFYGDTRFTTSELIRAAGMLQLGGSLAAFIVLAVPFLAVAPPGSSGALVLSALALFALVEGFGIMGAGLLRALDRNALFLALSLLRLFVAVFVGAIGAKLAGASGALFGVALAGIGFAAVAGYFCVRATSSGRNRSALRLLIGYGPPLIALSLLTWTLSLSDRIFLRAWESAVELAEYSANYRVGAAVTLFVAGPLALAWLPEARAAAKSSERQLLTMRWATAFGWIALGSVAVLVALADTLVPFVFGPQFNARPEFVALVGVSGWLFGLYFLVATPLMLGESTAPLATIVVGVILFNVIANAVLIRSWGTNGAAAATVVSYLALCATTVLAVRRLDSPAWMLSFAHAASILLLVSIVFVAVFAPVFAMLALAVALAVCASRLTEWFPSLRRSSAP